MIEINSVYSNKPPQDRPSSLDSDLIGHCLTFNLNFRSVVSSAKGAQKARLPQLRNDGSSGQDRVRWCGESSHDQVVKSPVQLRGMIQWEISIKLFITGLEEMEIKRDTRVRGREMSSAEESVCGWYCYFIELVKTIGV